MENENNENNNENINENSNDNMGMSINDDCENENSIEKLEREIGEADKNVMNIDKEKIEGKSKNHDKIKEMKLVDNDNMNVVNKGNIISNNEANKLENERIIEVVKNNNDIVGNNSLSDIE